MAVRAVIEDVYHAFKKYGKDQVRPVFRLRGQTKFTEDESEMIDAVLRRYGGLSGLQLSTMTHSDGSPWHQVKSNGQWWDSGAIPNDLIQKYHADAYQRYQDELAAGTI